MEHNEDSVSTRKFFIRLVMILKNVFNIFNTL